MAGNNEAPDPEAAEAALIDRVADGSVIRRALGDDALWLPAQRGAQRKRSGSNGVRSSAGRSPVSAAASSSPLIGPRATPAPSWPVATHRPATARDGPSAGSPSGSHGRRPAQRPPAQLRHAGHQPGRALAHRCGEGRIGRGVEPAPLAARADQHVAVPRRLDHGRDLQSRLGRRDVGEVGAVEDLVARRASRRGAAQAGPCAARAGGAGRRRGRARRSTARRRARPRRRAASPRRSPRPCRARSARPASRSAPARPAPRPSRGRSRAGRTGGRRGSGRRRAGPGRARARARAPARARAARSARPRRPAARAAPARPRAPRRHDGRPGRPCGGCGRARRSAARCPRTRPSRAGELELRPGVPVRAQHVALPEPGRAAGDLARVDQVHLDAARRERAGRRGADDPARRRRRPSSRARSRPGTDRPGRAGTGPSR